MGTFFCLLALVACVSTQADPYEVAQAKWREQRAVNLKAEGGWLSVAGLLWLKEGENPFGSKAALAFPAGAPARAGVLRLSGGKVALKPSPGVKMTRGGKAITDAVELKTDAQGAPDRVTFGNITFAPIVRGGRTGVRIWDRDAESLRKFSGLSWYPLDPAFRIQATYVPYEKPRTLQIVSILGDIDPSENPGYVEFVLDGRTHRLEAQSAGNQLFFNFKDLTNGEGTYDAGRFLYTDLPKDGVVTLDFNRAVNPPCNYTDFATCPLPPRENHLQVAIPAGEKKYVMARSR